MLDPVARDRPRIRPQRPNCEDAHPVHEVEFDDPSTIHSRLGESELPEVHQAAVDLLELLKNKLPDKCGEASGWNFEKAHSILHKVREIVLWGNSDNTSCQGAEHAHIELIKSVAHLTNNNDVFLCILRSHTRVGFLRHYERLLSEVDGFPCEPADEYAADTQILCDRNFNVACETGIRYPTMPAMLNRDAMHLRFSVRRISLVVP